MNSDEITTLIEKTADAAVSKCETRMMAAFSKAISDHQHNCPKFELGLVKVLTACLGSGIVVAIIGKLWR
jgi:hypothetical protein